MPTTTAAPIDHYLELLAPLSASDKLMLIARLSAELVGWTDTDQIGHTSAEPPTSEPAENGHDRGKLDPRINPGAKWPDLGADWPDLKHEWVGDESADELSELLRSLRSAPREPVNLGI